MSLQQSPLAHLELPVLSNRERDNTKYKYTSLSTQHDEIRCLTLFPGTKAGNEPLACTLKTLRLSDKPAFEAISYVWGSDEKSQSIMCNDREIDITTNLYQHLLQIRLPDKERMLWADCICINQIDKNEKSRQVRLMKDIYSQAAKVLICVGVDSDSDGCHCGENAASLIAEVSEMVTRTLGDIEWAWDSFPWLPPSHPLLVDPRWRCLRTLFQRPWFNRGWVVEEAALAAEAQVLWGDIVVDWTALNRTISWMKRRAPHINTGKWLLTLHQTAYWDRFIDEAKAWHSKLKKTLNLGFLEVLYYGGETAFYDPRDRIYGFLGLPAAAEFRDDIVVDYKAPYHQVYRDFATQYITKTGRADFLQYVTYDVNIFTEICPSWVPQWDFLLARRLIVNVWHLEYGAIAPPVSLSTSSLRVVGDNLVIRGILIDHVAVLSDTLNENSTIDDVASVYTAVRDHSPTAGYYEAFSPLLAFFTAITMGTGNPVASAGNFRASVGAYMLRLHNEDTLPNDPSLDDFRDQAAGGDADSLHPMISKCVHNRRAIVTRRGCYGLVPWVAREGDIMGILYGTTIPFLLRATSTADAATAYKLVGGAYIVSSHDPRDSGHRYPHRFGSAVGMDGSSEEDWLGWGLEEQDICLC